MLSIFSYPRMAIRFSIRDCLNIELGRQHWPGGLCHTDGVVSDALLQLLERAALWSFPAE
jgi:hypothetical protein